MKNILRISFALVALQLLAAGFARGSVIPNTDRQTVSAMPDDDQGGETF